MAEAQSAITDEGVAALRNRIGIPVPHTQPPHYFSPNEDAFRHVAESYGDDNPLWCDPTYAHNTVWGGSIASPHFNGGDTLIGENDVIELDADTKALLKGDPIRGAHAFYSGSFREWWSPLRPGMRIRRRNALVGVHDKQSEFATRAVHEWTGEVFAAVSPAAQALSAQYRLMIRTDRSKAAASDKHTAITIAPYTTKQLAEIDAAYAAEPAARRGATPRLWEDVNEGDELTPIVKGPMRVTDMVVWHTGVGMGLYGVKALRLGYQQRQRMPKFFKPDALNIPDVQQRVHWDPEWARAAGNPASYDYGRMRETWLIHLVTDWMGDDAWLWKLDCQFRKFNYVGDTHWMHGRVTRKFVSDAGQHGVDLEIWGVNQRGDITTPGHASVLLPSREHGVVRLPDPPNNANDCEGVLQAVVERFANDEHLP